MSIDESGTPANPSNGRFASTHWSLVTAARDDSPTGREALARLCQLYWYPLYAFARRQGNGAAAAQDLTQDFFAELLEKGYLDAADRDRGRFRTFLLTAFKRFASKQWAKQRAIKRGGNVLHLSLDWEQGEERYGVEPSHVETAERLFERRWALTLLESALARVKSEHLSKQTPEHFDALKPFLTGDANAPPYTRVAEQLGVSEGAVKVSVHRLRQKYRHVIREQIAETVRGEDEIEDELRALLNALREDN